MEFDYPEQKTITEIEEEIIKANAQKALLLKQKEIIEKKIKEEKDRYIVIE